MCSLHFMFTDINVCWKLLHTWWQTGFLEMWVGNPCSSDGRNLGGKALLTWWQKCGWESPAHLMAEMWVGNPCSLMAKKKRKKDPGHGADCGGHLDECNQWGRISSKPTLQPRPMHMLANTHGRTGSDNEKLCTLTAILTASSALDMSKEILRDLLTVISGTGV